MITIIVILLFISQLLCFYFLALLNAKVSKFKDLEEKQKQLIREMEDSFSLYLVEIREENDRLIKELSKSKNINNIEKKLEDVAIINSENQNKEEIEKTLNFDQKVLVPRTIVQNAYNKYKNPKINLEVNSDSKESNLNTNPKNGKTLTFEQLVLKLHKEGKTIEEIAKVTNKGKTEIELFLKFNT